MSPHTLALIVAASLLVSSIINGIILTILSPQRMIIRVIRFILTCVVAWFFARGAVWARWLVGLGAVLGFVLTGYAIYILPVGNYLIGWWLLLNLVYEGFVVYYVLFNKKLSQHFSPASGF